jgi:hypothetical protein
MDITVALPSGQNASLSVAADATVGWLKCAAQQRLKTQGLLQLLTKEGQMLLAPQRCLWEEGLKDGDAKFIYEQFCLLLLKCGMICFRDKASCAVKSFAFGQRNASLPWWRCRTWPPPSQPL